MLCMQSMTVFCDLSGHNHIFSWDRNPAHHIRSTIFKSLLCIPAYVQICPPLLEFYAVRYLFHHPSPYPVYLVSLTASCETTYRCSRKEKRRSENAIISVSVGYVCATVSFFYFRRGERKASLEAFCYVSSVSVLGGGWNVGELGLRERRYCFQVGWLSGLGYVMVWFRYSLAQW